MRLINMKIATPSKIILFGEHYVVYGAPSFAIPLDRYNYITFEEIEGETRFEIINPMFGNVTIYPDGKYEVQHETKPGTMKMFIKIYQRLIEKTGMTKAYKGTWGTDGVIKSMGGSASYGSTFAYGLYKLNNIDPSEEEMFECVQIGDEYAHGGRPSGIDAKTVTSGVGIKFWKEFNPTKIMFEKIQLVLPKNTDILIIDTFKGIRGNTGDLVKLFAKNHNITTSPQEMTPDEIQKVIGPYNEIAKQLFNELNINGNPQKLGELLNQNHELLKQSGVSTNEIEEVRNIALENGALGTKLTGAGGPGGAVIVYCDNSNKNKIIDALNKMKYTCLDVGIAKHGPKIVD